MTSHTVTIKNASQIPQRFLLFMSPPTPANISSSDVFNNVYMHSPEIAGDGSARASFEISTDYYAIIGTSERTGDGSVSLSSSDSRRAKLGPNGSSFTVSTLSEDDGQPDGSSPFFKSEDSSTSAQGAFTIKTDGSFRSQTSGDIYIGVGAQDPRSGDVVPVQTFKAEGNVNSMLFPKAIYYIATGHHRQGTIISMQELGPVLKIDFTGAQARNATFTFNDRSEYQADPAVDSGGIKWTAT